MAKTPAQRNSHALKRRETVVAYLFMLPALFFFVAFVILPMITGVVTSLFNYTMKNPVAAENFIGLKNYIDLFQDKTFLRAMLNTLILVVVTVPAVTLFSLWVSSAIYQMREGVRSFFRCVFYLPVVTGTVAVVVVWKWMFNTEYGIINTLLGNNVNWITNPNVVMVTCAIVAIWSAIGYDAVLLLSGLQNISKSYYEAASLDGATKIQQFFHITLPMVSPTLFVVMIMRLMSSLKVYDLIYMMVEESNPALTSAQSLMFLFYRESFVAGNKGYGSAVVIWTVLLIGIVTAFQFWGQKKWVNYEV